MHAPIPQPDILLFGALVFVKRVRKPAADAALVAAGLATADRLLQEMSQALAINPWLAGATLRLADLWAAPMFAIPNLTVDGRAAIARAPAAGVGSILSASGRLLCKPVFQSKVCVHE
jgi:glutathione S-transferase